MATTIARHHLALFLLLVQFADAALLPTTNTKNHAARSSSTYIVHTNHLAKPSPFATLHHWYTSMVAMASHSPRGGGGGANDDDDPTRLLYTYDAVMHGFAVHLTGDEARRMSRAPSVVGVYEDRVLYPHTTRSPGFMGLEPGTGAWKQTDFGDGVIIGFVDSGVWPESPSFRDAGLGPVRSSWKGRCVDAHDFNASRLCNNKLVGARSFALAGSRSRRTSARDALGHGTHVASTAAGSEVPGRDTGLAMLAQGTARGVAPKARVAAYSVVAMSYNTADSVAAIDAAVKDGVDIISMSVGYPPAPFYDDPLAIAVFGAENKGVFVVLSGGNDGPGASTVQNVAPWMTSVGAGTVDRLLPARLRLGDGTELAGQSLCGHGVKTGMVPLVFSACSGKADTDKITGKIAVCVVESDDDDGGFDFFALKHARPAGLVLIDPDETCIGDHPVPTTLVISDATAVKLKAYMKSVQIPVASLGFAVEAAIGVNRAPVVARFSSRGPNPIVPELLKPDVIAPGVNILAAWTGDDPFISPADPRRNNNNYNYKLASGTSMACPHVAGVAALIKKKHPSWTPAMVRSALMTTAGMVDNRGGDILDNGHRGRRVATPLVAGAGHVRPDLALDPGLVYDAGERDYVDFLCALNYTAEQMRRFAPDFVNCTGTLVGGPAGLNYPSFVVVFDSRADVRTLTRTLTKVSEEAETYSVTVVAPEHVKVTVTPATIEFKEHMESRSYSVEFRREAGGNREWDFGKIIWASGKHKVRSPVAFHWKL